MFLQWDDGFETGVPAADLEHGKMVDLVNTAYARWQRTGAGDRSKLFSELARIFLAHFKFEDDLMVGSDYADRVAHGQDHDRVLERLRGILARTDDTDVEMLSVLASCLEDWLASHIRDHDAPLYKTLASGRMPVASRSYPQSGPERTAVQTKSR